MTIEVKWSERANLPELPKDHAWVIRPEAVIIERTLSEDLPWGEHSEWFCSCRPYWSGGTAKIKSERRKTVEVEEIPRTLIDKLIGRTRTRSKRVSECRIIRAYLDVATVYTRTVVTEGNIREYALKALVQLEADQLKAKEAARVESELTKEKAANAHLYGRWEQ